MTDLRADLIIVSLGTAMIISAIAGRRQWWAIAVLAILSVVWLLVDQNFEGRTVLHIVPSHGVTSADFVGIAGLIVAGLLALRSRRR
jgi:MYXO-CTERM domain-containing protein